MSDQSGTAKELWYTIIGEGDQWYVMDRRDNSHVLGCRYAGIATAIAKDLNSGLDLQGSINRLLGIWRTH